MNKQKVGRKKIFETSELITMVDSFFLYEAKSDPNVMNSHGIYERLADYANKMFKPVKRIRPYHFGRDAQVKEHIQKLSQKVNVSDSPGRAYIPLDVDLLELKSRAELINICVERDRYYGLIYQNAVSAARNLDATVTKNQTLKQEVSSLLEEVSNLKEKNRELLVQIKAIKTDNTKYRKMVNKLQLRLCDQLNDERNTSFSGYSYDKLQTIADCEINRNIGEMLAPDMALFDETQKQIQEQFDPIKLFTDANETENE